MPAKPTATRPVPRVPDILAFDPKRFLTKIEDGKTTREYRNKQVVFSQGDAADAVFYIQSGKVKLTVVSTRGKEAVDNRRGGGRRPHGRKPLAQRDRLADGGIEPRPRLGGVRLRQVLPVRQTPIVGLAGGAVDRT